MQTEKSTKPELMWTPKPDSGSKLKEFKDIIEKKYKKNFGDYWSFHQWTIENIPEFWEEIWNFSEIIHSKPYEKVVDCNATCRDMPKWFKGAELNYAENLLKYRDDHVAMILAGEERQHPERVTFSQVYQKTCEYAAAMRKCGVKKGDRVVCFISNREEPVYAMLGATSIGAIWSGALPLLGAKAVVNRFKLIKPKLLLTIDRFVYEGEEKEMLSKVEEIANGLPSLEKIVLVPTNQKTLKGEFPPIRNCCLLNEFLALGRNEDGSVPDLKFEQLPFDHPVCISYTSGTTGTPKPLVHGIGALLTMMMNFYVHHDSNRENVWLSMSSAGWMSWNISTSFLQLGITVVLFEGVPFFLSPTYLWDIVDEFKISNLITKPSVLDELEKKNYLPTSKHNLNSLKTILGVASVVKPQNYDFAYKKVKPDIMFGAVYASTEIMGLSMVLEHTLPIYRGEMNAPALGVEISCYDESGNPVIGEVGEMIIKTPIPSLPLGLWGDEDGKKYKESYCGKFKGGFTTGDICRINPVTKGIMVLGRSDDTLKPKGARFGSSEIYNVVEAFQEIWDSICVSQYNADRDERAVLFIKMKKGQKFDEELVQRIRRAIERELSKRHIPEVILEVQDIPYNLNGKKMEVLVKKIINRMQHSPDTIANPECLKHYENIPELKGY